VKFLYGRSERGPSDRVRSRHSMLRQIAFGSTVSLANIAVHAMAMIMVIRAARSTAAKWLSFPTLRLSTVMIATVAVLMAAHLCEIAIWSLAYAFVEATPEGAEALYFAFVNFTTLGYGDIVPVPRWRLLGPMTAMNGVLLFGWSTAVIFDVLSTALLSAPK
jgi:Ion channel